MTETNRIPLLDLHAQFRSVEAQVRAAVDRVLQSQHFILGPEVEALEREVASYVTCRDGVGVSSGSDALILGLMALGIGPGDEVITSPYTFFATVGAISRLGAQPVLVDIDAKSFNIDPSKISERLSPNTKAIIPVHLFGQSAEMVPILDIAHQHSIAIIEDAAQAIGTDYQEKRVGSFGTLSCFSFFPSKNLGAFGDGGMVTTNDSNLADKMRILRSHGSKPKYFHKWVGGNFRLDAIQAAVLRAKLPTLEIWTQGRRHNADRYDQMFKRAKLEEFIEVPWRRSGDRHIFNQYVVRARRRDELRAYLEKQGIGTEVYYPVPMHLQECFAPLSYRKGDFPEAERAAEDSLALPIYPELTEAQQQRVVDTIRSFYS